MIEAEPKYCTFCGKKMIVETGTKKRYDSQTGEVIIVETKIFRCPEYSDMVYSEFTSPHDNIIMEQE